MKQKGNWHFFGLFVLFLAIYAGVDKASAATCDYYVRSTASDANPGTGDTDALAFRSLARAEQQLEYLAKVQNGYVQPTFTFHGQTYNKYPLNASVNVCVDSGVYSAPAVPPTSGETVSSPSTKILDSAQAVYQPLYNYALEIKVSGSPSALITFKPTPGSPTAPEIIQTGFGAVVFFPTASYITVTGFNIHGHASDALPSNNATLYGLVTGRYPSAPGTTGPGNTVDGLWPYWDGNCVFVKGNAANYDAVDYVTPTDPTHPVLLPVGVPTHIEVSHSSMHDCGGGGLAAAGADYITFKNNEIYNNAWWSTFGTSGMSIQSVVDSETYPTRTGNVNIANPKIVVKDNKIWANREYVRWRAPSPPAITDGEGIIVDTIVNGITTSINDPVTGNPTGDTYTLSPYLGKILISNNVLWNNGSSAIQVFKSEGVYVLNNATYNNLYYPFTPANNASGTTPLTLPTNNYEMWLHDVKGDATVENNIFDGKAPIGGYNDSTPTNGVPTPSIFLAGNLYDSPTSTTVAALVAGIGGPSGSVTEVASTERFGNPQYVLAPPDNTSTANLGVSNSGSPAYGLRQYGSSFYSQNSANLNTDIIGATQPGSAVLSGAYANVNPPTTTTP